MLDCSPGCRPFALEYTIRKNHLFFSSFVLSSKPRGQVCSWSLSVAYWRKPSGCLLWSIVGKNTWISASNWRRVDSVCSSWIAVSDWRRCGDSVYGTCSLLRFRALSIAGTGISIGYFDIDRRCFHLLVISVESSVCQVGKECD